MALKKYTPLSRADENRRRYLKEPTYEQVKNYIQNEQKTSLAQFERFWGMAAGTIKKMPNQGLPAKWWHVFYEKITPAYGVGYASKQSSKKQYSKLPIKPKKEAVIKQTETNNLLLEKLKQQLN